MKYFIHDRNKFIANEVEKAISCLDENDSKFFEELTKDRIDYDGHSEPMLVVNSNVLVGGVKAVVYKHSVTDLLLHRYNRPSFQERVEKEFLDKFRQGKSICEGNSIISMEYNYFPRTDEVSCLIIYDTAPVIL